MKQKRRYIVLFIILAIFFLIMFLSFGLSNIKEGKYATTILLGDNTVWRYSDRGWLDLKSQSSIDKLNWQKYKVFIDNREVGNYFLWHDDKWYAFDEKRNAINLENGNFLAYSANFNLKVSDFEMEEISDRTYIDYVLKDNNLDINSLFTSSGKISLDFDNDNLEEDFYLISNAFSDEFYPETVFSIVFMVKNNEVFYIYKDISENRSFNGCKPYFNSFLDVDNDNNYEFILSCGRYSISEQVDMLYDFSKEEGFKIVISNQ